MPEKPHTENIQAKHDFTPAELQQLADNLTAAMERRADLDGQLASIKSDYKGKLESVESEMLRLASKHRSRFEMRDTLAIVAFSTPKPGRKTYYFALQNGDGSYHPGQIIREDEMTHADLQRTLPLEDAVAKAGEAIAAIPGVSNVTISHGGEKIYDSSAPSKEVPPPGFALVTEGHSREGDICWVAIGQWEPVKEGGIPALQYKALARPLNADAGTTPVAEALAAATPQKKPRKKREPFVQPPGMVNVAGKDEHYLVLDLTGVETVAGITPLFRAAYKKAKWSDESVASIWDAANSINEMDRATELKAMLERYTCQPEPAAE